MNEGRFTVNLIRANGVGLCGKVLVHVVEGGPISVAATTPTQAVYEALTSVLIDETWRLCMKYSPRR